MAVAQLPPDRCGFSKVVVPGSVWVDIEAATVEEDGPPGVGAVAIASSAVLDLISWLLELIALVRAFVLGLYR